MLINPHCAGLLILSKLSSSLFALFISLDPGIAIRFLHTVWLLRLQLLTSSATFVPFRELQFSPFSGHTEPRLPPGRLHLLPPALACPVQLLLHCQRPALLLRVLRGRAPAGPENSGVLLPKLRLFGLHPLSSHPQRLLQKRNKL